MRNFSGTQISTTSTEQWLAYIRAGQAFAFSISLAANAANNGHVQLYNPNANSKTILVRRAYGSLGVSDRFDLNFYDTQLTTDAGTGFNLLRGGAASTAHIRTGYNAGELGSNLVASQLLANTKLEFGPDWLCQLAPNQGVLCTTATVNEVVVATYFWAEV